MATMLKRLFWLAALGGAGYAVWTLLQSRDHDRPAGGAGADEWPKITADPAASPQADPPVAGFGDVDGSGESASDAGAPADTSPAADDPATGGDAARWVEPTDGACPLSHPVKANDNSGIYHVPGGRFYERTGAERCYARADDAEADGYRAAKS